MKFSKRMTASVLLASSLLLSGTFNDSTVSAANTNIEYQFKNGYYNNEQVQWGFFAHGFNYAHEAGYTGKGVKIAVIDSGYIASSDLAISFKEHDGSTIENTEQTSSIMKHHGTYVTKIINAKKNNSKLLGNVPDAEVTFYNFSKFQLMKNAVEEAIKDGNHIINISMSSRFTSDQREKSLATYNRYFKEAVELAKANNVAIVISTGNYKEGYLNMYLAHDDYVFGVGAVNGKLELADFSTYDEIGDVDFVGAGQGIMTYNEVDKYFHTIQGTSYSSPQITSMLAVIKQMYPNATVNEMRELLAKLSIDLGEEGFDAKYGHGLPSFRYFNFESGTVISETQRVKMDKELSLQNKLKEAKETNENLGILVKDFSVSAATSKRIAMKLDNGTNIRSIEYSFMYNVEDSAKDGIPVKVTLSANKKNVIVTSTKPLPKGHYVLSLGLSSTKGKTTYISQGVAHFIHVK